MGRKNNRMDASSSGKLKVGLRKGGGGSTGKSQPKPKAGKK